MKKIFTSFLFAAFALIGLNAQSFEFRMNGEKVADGATVTGFICNKHIVKQQWTHKTEDILSLYNLTDKDIKYTVEIKFYDNTMNASTYQICMGGECQDFSKFVNGYIKYDATYPLPANGSAETLVDAMTTQKEGHIFAELTVTSGLESHNVIIKFEYADPAGISAIQTAGGVVDVYNVAGNLVKSNYDVNNIKNLARGLYIIRGKNTKAHKIVVK